MDEEKKPYTFHSADESPIPVPPVEEAWPLMKQKLDAQMPVMRRWYDLFNKPRLWSMAGAVCAAGALVVWSVSHPTHKDMRQLTPANVVQAQRGDDSGRTVMREQGGNDSGRATVGPRSAMAAERQGEIGELAGREKDSAKTTAGAATGNAAGRASSKTTGGVSSGTAGRISSGTAGRSGATASEAGKNRRPGKNLINGTENGTRHMAGRNGTHGRRRNGTPAASKRMMNAANKPGGTEDNGRPVENGRPDRKETTSTAGRRQGKKIPVWVRPGAGLAKTKPVSPKFITASDSLLRAAHANKKNKDSTHHKAGLLMTAGLSLAQSFPVGQQQFSSRTILSDYIPAPYFRFYIGDRCYLQTAVHFNSPQYTKSQLIDSAGGDTTQIPGYPAYLQYNKIILQKLYYTDIPLTFNYRVFKGLYLGAGIQYSRLWGAAGQEQVVLHSSNNLGVDTIYSSKKVNLKNDTLGYRKLAKSDWRVLFEADYKWRRFTFGLRYEQALKTYLPVKGTDKNSSFSIHIYYDLWERNR